MLGLDVTPAAPGHWIVIVEAEHGRSSAARKLVKSANALGLDSSCLDRIITIPRSKVVIDSAEWKEVERMIAAGIVSDVVVDSLARWAPAKANDEQEQAAIFGKVAAAIESSRGTQPTFWIIMHSRKGDQTGNTEDIGGSQQRGGQTDSPLRCTAVKDENHRIRHVEVTFGKLREDPDVHPGRRAFAMPLIDGQWCYRDVGEDERRAMVAERREKRAEVKAAKKEEKRLEGLDKLKEILKELAGINDVELLEKLRAALGTCSRETKSALVARAVQEKWCRIEDGPKGSKQHYFQGTLC